MGIFRLFLALSVVIGHNQFASTTVGPGVYIAVKAFFVVSGFYMALILSGRYDSAKQFYVSRFFRLYPVYIAVLCLTFAAAWAAGGHLNVFVNLAPWSQISGVVAGVLAFMNISMIGIDLSVLTCAGPAGIALYLGGCPDGAYLLNNFMLVPQAWSISLELLFYAVVPFVARISTRGLVALIVAGLLVRVGISATDLNVNPWHRSVAPFELVYFFLGMAAYRVYQSGSLRHPAFGLGLLAVTPFYHMIGPPLGMNVVTTENLTWWVYIGATTLALPSLFALTKAAAWDRAIGELSYPVYIGHILVMAVIDRAVGMQVATAVGPGAWLALNISAILVFSWVCVAFIQAPFDALRYRLAFRDRPPSAAVQAA